MITFSGICRAAALPACLTLLAIGLVATSPASPAAASSQATATAAAAALANYPASAVGSAYTQTGASHAATPGTIQSDPCTYGSSNGNVNTCMSYSISGTYINYIDGTATVINVPRKLTICIHSSVRGTIKCNREGYITVNPGGHIYVNWNPKSTQPSANYCVRTWRKNNDGTNTLIGEICIST